MSTAEKTPLPLSVEIAREIGYVDWDRDTDPTGDCVKIIDARIRPLVEALQAARGYVADYAVTTENEAGKLLAQIDAALHP